MTDDRQWEPPGPQGDSAGAAAWPSLAPPPSGGPDWTPPPRPGLVPLRPLTLGTIIAGSFGVLRRNALATYGPALLVSLAVAVVQSLGTISLLSTLLVAGSNDTATSGEILNGLGGGLVTSAGSAVLALVAAQLVLAVVSLAVTGATVGERRSAGAIWRRTARRRWAVIGWAVLVAAAVLVAIGATTAAIVGLGVAGGPAGAVAAALLALLAIPAGIVLWFWTTTKLSFVTPVLVVERLRMRAAIARAWRLTRGSFWRVLGIRLLVGLMVGIAQALLTLPLSMLVQFATALLLPNGDSEDSARAIVIATTIAGQTLGAFIAALGVVLTTATTALLYVDVRMRREGLDLELSRYVEHPPAARAGLADPFRRPERA